ncbi:MAG: hypothetical protein VR64_20495 [Desulfatitalea sp. BRH_c12]|nr:MAG: hypothetical protein VR64_20495 [Desulfatitalea sp. BRH_c12]
MWRTCLLLLWAVGLLLGCGGGSGGDTADNSSPPDQDPSATAPVVLAFNDLGMHCMDREFSIFSILPPFNVVHAQVVLHDTGGLYLAEESQAQVSYQAVADPAGSINSFSVGKTDFWDYADQLFGANLQPGEGLTGSFMPDDYPLNRGSQPMDYSLPGKWYSAEGIPITPFDDMQQTNAYPLMRISARSNDESGSLDVVVPVATETNCRNCHATGQKAAENASITWSDAVDVEVQSKINILRLHDAEHSTSLDAVRPVLCAGCHYSPALDLAGSGPSGEQVGRSNFSAVMHNHHGKLVENNAPVFDPDGTVESTCYQCHPGSATQCQRGAMKTGGMQCQDCHGDMLSVGAEYPLMAGGSIDGTNDGMPRRPWQDLPRCQSCHTGDAVSHLSGSDFIPAASGIRLIQAYRANDPSASPILAVNQRFAENSATLFRNSKGHGGIGCEGCHGSTHAIWPNADPDANDNIASKQLQGFSGTLITCTACHGLEGPPLSTQGPHGLHPVNDSRWLDEDGHGDYFEVDPAGCRACHGLDLAGTVLSRMPVDRTFKVEGRTVNYVKGQVVRCDRCHGMPEA